ncbi:hypothetical protein CTRI78_v003111 [Colletotrichum trifolii]|uniref:Uncharacterized protein n=1 Tax=Colletotrichum trifolii TaxID=5466 RepID=A0A4R8RWD3_COLTR|nr:hypothetical protein CTRI78_v003111 [Colletotrichum trifolii]
MRRHRHPRRQTQRNLPSRLQRRRSWSGVRLVTRMRGGRQPARRIRRAHRQPRTR